MNQAYLANYIGNGTDIMVYDDASNFVFTITHGFKPSPGDDITWENGYNAITDNTYTAAQLDTWQMLIITPDLLANSYIKFKITDGTTTYTTTEMDMNGLTTLRLWVYITAAGLTLQAGLDIFAQVV